MRRSNHTDAEIIALLREAEEGVPIEDICASAYVSTRTFYRWRKQFGGLVPDAIRRLRTLEQENQHLRVLVGRLKGDNPGGAWSGWTAAQPSVAAPAAMATVLPAAPGLRDGTSSGRFASIRAGRS